MGGSLGALLGSYAPVSSSFESIATATPNGSNTVTFSSIPSTYSHLQIRYTARTGNTNGLNLNFNGDTSSSAYWHLLYGTGTSAAAYTISTAYIQIGGMQSAANTFIAGTVDILDYANTNKNKTIRSLNGWDANGSGTVYFYSGQWINTVATTSLTISSQDGSNFVAGTQFALYGIK